MLVYRLFCVPLENSLLKYTSYAPIAYGKYSTAA